MTTERCERCDRPVATEADWQFSACPACHGDLGDDACAERACKWDVERCWGAESCAAHAIDWPKVARHLAGMVAIGVGRFESAQHYIDEAKEATRGR
jgi:hypothetical protein